MNIITGYRGEPHITSAQDRAGNQGSYGTGSYVLNVGNKLAATIASANEIRIADGALCHQGCLANIDAGTYDSVAINNGTQGMNRIDRIVARYTKNAETNVESLDLVVIEGTAVSGTPSAPAYNTGNIQNGDSPVDMPLYQVRLTGVTVASVTKEFDYVRTQKELDAAVSSLNSKTVATSQVITSFYDNRCENIAEAEKTFIMKFGSINIAVICVKMKTAVTSQQTSIFTLPSGYNPPANYQSYGVVYNRTTGKTYQAQVSSAGNVNIINRGELAVGDYLYGQIAWMA